MTKDGHGRRQADDGHLLSILRAFYESGEWMASTYRLTVAKYAPDVRRTYIECSASEFRASYVTDITSLLVKVCKSFNMFKLGLGLGLGLGLDFLPSLVRS